VLTDGNRLYFAEFPPAGVSIGQVSVTGGETAPVIVPFENPILQDVSPDRSELLLRQSGPNGGPAWSLPLPAGSPRRLSLEMNTGIWAPDGKLLFAKANDNDLYIADNDGANPHKLATASDPPGYFAFSPDGTRLRFSTMNPLNNTYSIWESHADGSAMHQL